MRIGLVGLGRIGQMHAQFIQEMSGISELILADSVPGRASEIAAHLQMSSVDDPREILSAGVDGLMIATATDAHPMLIAAACDAGIPVFCEKPISGSIASSLRLVERLAGKDVPVQIGFQRRFDPAFMAAHDAVANGELGWLHTIRSTTMDPTPPPAEYIATSGGIFRDCAVHDFDAVRWVSGQDIVEVFATGSNQGESFFTDAGDVDTASTILKLSDGTIAVVSNSRYNSRGYDVRLEVHGSLDAVAVGLDPHLPLRSVEPGVEFPGAEPHGNFMYRFEAAYKAEVEFFFDVARGTFPSPCTLDDALAAEWAAHAAGMSLAQQRPVTIDEAKASVGS